MQSRSNKDGYLEHGYELSNKGWNNIGNKGCQYLSQTNMPMLQHIEVRTFIISIDSKFNSKGAKISVKGLRYILKTEWSDQAIHGVSIGLNSSQYSNSANISNRSSKIELMIGYSID